MLDEKQRLDLLEKRYKKVKETAKKFLQDNQNKRLFYSCKGNAKRKGIEFTLNLFDIKITSYCPYLGIPITNISNKGRVATNASIDRIDSTKGYSSGNIQIISDLANRMKQNATEEQLIAFAKGVLKIHAGIDVDKIVAESRELQQIPRLCKD